MSQPETSRRICRAGKLLKRWRLKKGIKRKDAANQLHVSGITLYNWETGRGQPEEAARADIETWTAGAVPASLWPRRYYKRKPSRPVVPFDQSKNF